MTPPGLVSSSSFPPSAAVFSSNHEGGGSCCSLSTAALTSPGGGRSPAARYPKGVVGITEHPVVVPVVLREAFSSGRIADPLHCHVYQTIQQENAVGYKVRIGLGEDRGEEEEEEEGGRPLHDEEAGDNANNDVDDDDARRTTKKKHRDVFVKVVQLSNYVTKKKDWADLRRTLLYARTEARFYREILPRLISDSAGRQGGGSAGNNAFTPHVYLARCDLEGWIHDDETATCPAPSDYPAAYYEHRKNPEERISDKGGWIVLECVDPLQYYQDSPLRPRQSVQCLKAVARLHAAAWQHPDLLEVCDKRLSRASFHLSLRNPKELAGIVDSWDAFCKAFESHLKVEGLDTEAFVNLGRRIERLAVPVSDLVSPGPHDTFATLIHGDYKALNVFLPRTDVVESDNDDSSNEDNCLMVDFASCGVGLGMSDLAMHVRHAVEPHHLAHGGEQHLVRQYWEYLHQLLLASRDADAAHEYTWEVAWWHYKLAVVDYFRFFLGRMWKSATPDTMRAKANNKNVSLINRSVPAAMAFLRNVEAYMVEIEAECRAVA
jgi:Ecdysteroid kinase-like family